ncbi:DUF3027 domain-containing protein [Microbacterium sp. CIAB417]|uniref:DUF3027 domain-containing protein n=1 Tax=Microbacterium sp. CIAB417 TaxID=2860287 RepID=UPI001FAC9D3D|nr:DUF3027 domain-containing protein [Microbacterium sp. CIAB417]
MTSTPEPDARLIDARDLALSALHEITAPSTVGPAAGHLVEEDGSLSLRFENRLAGYPGWYWTVTVARVDDEEPTVLEVELLPGDGALLAPDWVPWAERLAEYRAHQAELAEQAAAEASAAVVDDDAEEDVDDEDADSEDDFDDDLDLDAEADEDVEDDLDLDEDAVSPRLHAGDLDGVDIDELDDSAPDEDEDELSDEDETELSDEDEVSDEEE